MPVVAVQMETELVWIEIAVVGAHPPGWAERAADATVVPHGSSAEFVCDRVCWVHVVARPERAIEAIDAVAAGLRVPGGECYAAMVGPTTPRMLRRTHRAVRGCRDGEGAAVPDEVYIPADARTAALLAAAPGGLLRDRLRAEGLVYTVEREPGGVSFAVRPEDRARADTIVAEVLASVPTVSPDRWAEADRVVEMDRLVARATPGGTARFVVRHLVERAGVAETE